MSHSRPVRPLVVIVGPTGTGKSQLAVSLAKRYNGEIVNGDALQVYEGLPITTNKIPETEREGIPHHLLGSLSLDEAPWTVKQYSQKARNAVEGVRSRGKLPIVVGGTQYYIQSLLFANSSVEDSQCEFLSPREEASKWPVLEAPTDEILQELRRVDPTMAARWHPKDRRKIRRSLEIWLQTGQRASQVYADQAKGEFSFRSDPALQPADQSCFDDLLIFWTHASAQDLNPRLDERVDEMMSKGLIDEARSMHDFVQMRQANGMNIDVDRGIWIAIGYKELLLYVATLDPSMALKAECIERTKISTRQYAKRQGRWLRLKMLPTLKDVQQEEKLFLLDASNLSGWLSNVEKPALDVLGLFLDGQPLPSPRSLSSLACETLVTQEKPNREAHYCEACNKTLMFEAEWLQHLRSKGHQYATHPKIRHDFVYPRKATQ